MPWSANTNAQARLAVARDLANGVLTAKKLEAILKARTSNKETMENHNGLNARSSLLARVISNGLAKPRPKYNAKKEKNRLAILIKSD